MDVIILFSLSGVNGEILGAVASGDSNANSIGMESWFANLKQMILIKKILNNYNQYLLFHFVLSF